MMKEMEILSYRQNVLSIERMQHLESLGIDTSNASCMWTSIQDNDYKPKSWLPIFNGEDHISIEKLREKFPLTYQEGNIYYCYTLGDLLEFVLPKNVVIINESNICRYMDNDKIIHQTGGENMTLLDAVYEMLLFCINNKKKITE